MTKAPNDPKPRINISLSAKNLGVLENLQHSFETDSCRIGIFANNGSGKIFISKAFAAYSQREKVPATDRLIRIDTDEAEFICEIGTTAGPEPDGKLAIKFKKENGLSTESVSKYLFHVFNSDYVRKNLDDRGYHPDGSITGVIIGEKIIDLTNEEDLLKEKDEERKAIEKSLKDKLDECRVELKNVGVAAKTNVYREITYENLLSPTYVTNEAESHELLMAQFAKLSSMPEDLADVPSIGSLTRRPNLEEIRTYLNFEFTRSHFDQEFKAKIGKKDDFIRLGLPLLNESICPFCEQTLGAIATELVDRYREFYDAEEAKAIKKAVSYRDEIELLKKDVGLIAKASTSSNLAFDSVKKYLSSAEELNFKPLPSEEELKRITDVILSALQTKRDDVAQSGVFGETDVAYSESEQFLRDVADAIAYNNVLISKINRMKNDLNSEQLRIRKRICVSAFRDLRAACASFVTRLEEVNIEISNLKNDIAEKKAGESEDKKRAVAKTFKQLLEIFFPNKYTFDDETFSLLFSDKSLNEGANDILSDGEKSIVGFCHYLASTHELVESQSDYKNLFFVIDDPISSMDFHFVYKIADCIRGLNKVLPLGDRFRYLILTHNLQFISLLERNNICGNILLLSDGKLTRRSAKSTLPYDLRLQDIVEVGAGGEVKHTTSNSIRHVLESIGAFLDPGSNSEKVFEEVASVRSNAYLWTLIQDQSHGVFGRDQSMYQEDDVRNGCNVIIDYLREKFPKQIERFAPPPAAAT